MSSQFTQVNLSSSEARPSKKSLFNSSNPPTPLQPYLGLYARYSQTWVSHILLSLLIVALSLLLSISAMSSSIASVKSSLAASCSGVENAATVAVSIPHFVADNINQMTAQGVSDSVDGLGKVLDFGVLALEDTLVFVVDSYKSLYLCLAQFLVQGTLSVLISGVEEAQDFVNDALDGIKVGINDAVSGLNSTITDIVNEVDKIPGVSFNPPNISPNLTALDNLTLPDTLSNALSSLDSSLPTLSEIKDDLDDIIRAPFEDLRALINSTLANITITSDLFPVPDKDTVAFCQDLDLSFIDKIGDTLLKFAHIALGLLGLVFLILLAFLIIKERYSYRSLIRHLEASREAWLIDSENSTSLEGVLSLTNLFIFLESCRNPLITRLITSFLFKRSEALRKSPRKRANLAWFLAYVTKPEGLSFLLIGVLGLITVQLQLLAISVVQKEIQDHFDATISNFTDLVVQKIDDTMLNSSTFYVNEVNGVLLGLQDEINTNMFGFVNETVEGINTTINAFYDEVVSIVNSTFSGTPLDQPLLNLVACVLGSKVTDLSTALTFISDNAQVTIPTFSSNLLVLSPNSTNSLISSFSSSTAGSSVDSSAQSLVDQIYDSYVKSLKMQRITFAVFLGIWGIVVLMGIIGVVGNEWRLKKAGLGGSSGTADGGEAERKRKRKEWDEFLKAGNNSPGEKKSWGFTSIGSRLGHGKNESGSDTTSSRTFVVDRGGSFEMRSRKSEEVDSSKRAVFSSLFEKIRPSTLSPSAPPPQQPPTLRPFALSTNFSPPPPPPINNRSRNFATPSRPVVAQGEEFDLLSPKALSPTRAAPSPPFFDLTLTEMGERDGIRSNYVVEGRRKINWENGAYGPERIGVNPFETPFDHPSEMV